MPPGYYAQFESGGGKLRVWQIFLVIFLIGVVAIAILIIVLVWIKHNKVGREVEDEEDPFGEKYI